MNIEEEIAQALAEWRSGENFEAWEVDMYAEAAAALMPLFRRAQAEAWGEAIEEQRLLAPANEADVPHNPYTEQEVEHE